MKVLKAVFGILITCLLVFLGNTKMGQLPPIARFVDPYHGFWQNAEFGNEDQPTPTLKLVRLKSQSNVILDERGVPHIFAENNHDLYFMQGYLTAKDRLWQMEFQTHAAAGRVSEIVGDKALNFDLEQRRIGMGWAAEQAMELITEDTISADVLIAYSEGVNSYIASLDQNHLPLEYKLLDYQPEQWTSLKSSLLLKYMAKMLTGTERDRPNTEALKLLGTEMFSLLFPDQNYLDEPIVAGFNPANAADTIIRDFSFQAQGSWDKGDIQPHFVGSNNWAASGDKHTTLLQDPKRTTHREIIRPHS
jgi:penicillin amidase